MADIETEGKTTIIRTTRASLPHEMVMIHRLLYFVLDVICGLLIIRFILRLAGANPGTGFVNFIYALTNPLVAPFRGIFPGISTGPGVVDWAALMAIIVYVLVIWLLLRLVRLAAE
jgi:YggT family protein